MQNWTDRTRTPPLVYWSAELYVLATDRGVASPAAGAAPRQWGLDTGNTDEALAWRYHLLSVGLDPDVRRAPVLRKIPVTGGNTISLPAREADLWLVSNLPITPF